MKIPGDVGLLCLVFPCGFTMQGPVEMVSGHICVPGCGGGT